MTEGGVAGLSARQRECLRLVGRGYSTKEIAEALGISPETARDHIDLARARLGVDRRMKAARLLAEYEAVNAPPWPGPPSLGMAADAWEPHPAPVSSTGQPEPILRDAAVPTYEAMPAAPARFRWPFPTEGRPFNHLAWYEQVAWAVAIAVGAIVAVHEVSSLLRG